MTQRGKQTGSLRKQATYSRAGTSRQGGRRGQRVQQETVNLDSETQQMYDSNFTLADDTLLQDSQAPDDVDPRATPDVVPPTQQPETHMGPGQPSATAAPVSGSDIDDYSAISSCKGPDGIKWVREVSIDRSR